jgi:TrmH family RNA methyltransferase
MQQDAAKNINIVLVCPKSPGNIGSVARVMMNTGFSNLSLVDPVGFDNDEAWSRACNADSVLKSAKVFSSLDSAIEDSSVVLAATRRRGKLRHPTLTLNEARDEIMRLAPANKISILFGREDHGLSNEEVERSNIVFEIPTHEDYPSLNLSHAVFSLCHTLFTTDLLEEESIKLAARGDVLKLHVHMEAVLRGLGYGEKDKGGDYLLGVILRNFRRLFGRTGLMKKEVNMIRGILARIEEDDSKTENSKKPCKDEDLAI